MESLFQAFGNGFSTRGANNNFTSQFIEHSFNKNNSLKLLQQLDAFELSTAAYYGTDDEDCIFDVRFPASMVFFTNQII